VSCKDDHTRKPEWLLRKSRQDADLCLRRKDAALGEREIGREGEREGPEGGRGGYGLVWMTGSLDPVMEAARMSIGKVVGVGKHDTVYDTGQRMNVGCVRDRECTLWTKVVR